MSSVLDELPWDRSITGEEGAFGVIGGPGTQWTRRTKSMSNLIRVENVGNVTTITIDRADKGNRVTNEMGAEVAEALRVAGSDGSRVVVFRGAGPDFCLGRDAKGASEGKEANALEIRDNNTNPALSFYGAFRECPIPIIGVARGGAIGMGAALAALCDITIAADTAKFRVPEMDHNIPPLLVGNALADRVSRKVMFYLIYSRDEIDAAQALEFGLISKIVPETALDAEVDVLAAKLADRDLAALKAIKTYVLEAPAMSRSGAIALSTNLLSNVMSARG